MVSDKEKIKAIVDMVNHLKFIKSIHPILDDYYKLDLNYSKYLKKFFKSSTYEILKVMVADVIGEHSELFSVYGLTTREFQPHYKNLVISFTDY